MEGGDETEEKADRKNEDAERDGFVSRINEKEGGGEKETKKSLSFMSVDREAMVGGV
jgi:hypothetical protein